MTEFEAKKVFLKDAQGDYVVPVSYSSKYDMDGDVIDVSSLQPDQVFDATSTRGQSGVALAEVIGALNGNMSVTELASSGTVSLEDNKIYRVTPSGSLSFVLPEGDIPVEVDVEGDWTTPVQVDSNIYWSGITYGNNKFVAVGWSGYVTTSENGTTWSTPVQVDSNISWKGVAYGSGRFVVVGDSGYISTSEDGTTWTTPVQFDSNIYWGGIIYANNKFVAVGTDGYVTTSENGTTWSTPVQFDSNIYWRDVAYGSGRFVVVGGAGTGRTGYITTSTDGTNWTTPVQIGDYSWYDIVYGNNKFVVTGRCGSHYNAITSVDGISWSNSTSIGIYVNGICYGNGKFVAVGGETVKGYVITSTDGVVWSEPIQTWEYAPMGITYGNNKFIVVGSRYVTSKELYTQTDYILDPSIYHHILVQVDLQTAQTINVGTTYFYNNMQPDISKPDLYNLIYEYDNNNNYWICGLLSKGQTT